MKPVLVCIFAALLFVFVQPAKADGISREGLMQKLEAIKELPPMSDPCTSEFSYFTFNDDPEITSFLINELDDMRDTGWFDVFKYRYRDYASQALAEKYKPEAWPFPSGHSNLNRAIKSKSIPRAAYEDFFSSAKNRKLLQDSWKDYVRSHKQRNLRESCLKNGG